MIILLMINGKPVLNCLVRAYNLPEAFPEEVMKEVEDRRYGLKGVRAC